MGKFGLTKRCRYPRRAWTNAEGVVDASASRHRSRPALGGERSVSFLLPRAAGEDEPPHARLAARGWYPPLERGADLHTVQLFLDHANMSTSSRYLKPSKLALHTAIQRIDPQRRESGEAAKWEQDLAELRKNLPQGHKRGHALIESSVSVRLETP
jgi:hypothetical protein